jgi:exopolysaccharide production protein ExoZ
MNQNGRIEGFDLLRGLCALGVVFYHLFKWFNLPVSYNLGLYGVYIFFVLSGASLYVAYASKLERGFSIPRYLGLRYFRLLPLYALVVFLTPFAHQTAYDWAFFKAVILNLTFAFGFANPGKTSLATGGWSLGIEFVFYLVFPVVVFAIAGKWWKALALTVAAFVCQVIFIHSVIGASLVENWGAYVQILAFAFYFAAGCAVGKFFATVKPEPRILAWPLFLLGLALIGFGSGATPEETLLGLRGAMLALACVGVVVLAGLLPMRWMLPAVLLGNMSYGVYLLHPVVHTLVARYAPHLRNNPLAYTVGIAVLTVILALLIEKYYERPIRRAGKRLFS